MPKYTITPEDIPDRISWLYDLVGLKLFLQIVDTAGGELIHIPKRSTLETPAKYRMVLMQAAAGDDTQAIALRHGMSVSQVREIIRKKEGAIV